MATEVMMQQLTEPTTSTGLLPRVIGRSIQALIIMIVLALVAHVLFGEGGGVGLLINGLFFPFSTSYTEAAAAAATTETADVVTST